MRATVDLQAKRVEALVTGELVTIPYLGNLNYAIVTDQQTGNGDRLLLDIGGPERSPALFEISEGQTVISHGRSWCIRPTLSAQSFDIGIQHTAYHLVIMHDGLYFLSRSNRAYGPIPISLDGKELTRPKNAPSDSFPCSSFELFSSEQSMTRGEPALYENSTNTHIRPQQ